MWNSGLALHKETIYANFSPLLHILQQVSQFTADHLFTESWNARRRDHGSGGHSNFFVILFIHSPYTGMY